MKKRALILMLICCFSIWGGGISAFSQSNDDFNPPNPEEPASINYCRLIVSADPAEGAYVSGGGKYVVGTSGQVYVSTNACNTEDYTYTFLYWTLNGVQTSYSQSFWFTPQKGKFELVAHYEKAEVVFDPNNPQEPSATDAKRKYRLYLTSSIEGACSFSMTSGDKHIEQTPLSISAYVNAGYQFDGWKLNGVLMDSYTSPYLYINMPSANSTLEACVSEIPFDPDSPMEPSGQNTGIDTSGRKIVNLSIGNSNQSVDQTRVVFNEERTLAYEQGYDASKFISTDAAFQIYSLGDNDTKYSVNQRPAGDGNVSLGIVVKQAGEVTISATRLDCSATLIDNLTHFKYNLALGGCTFNCEAGTFDDRFVLTINEQEVIMGDVNDDGRVNVTDIMAVASYILKYDLPSFNVAAADVNGDGKINVTDIMGIANIILQPNNANNAPMLQMVLKNDDEIDPE